MPTKGSTHLVVQRRRSGPRTRRRTGSGELALIEREAGDERHFVKKAVNLALRAIGKRNRPLDMAT